MASDELLQPAEKLGIRVVRGVLERRCTVTVVWLLVFLGCLPLAYLVQTNTVTRLLPAKNLPSGKAYALMKREFPRRADETHEMVMVTCYTCTSILDEPFTRAALNSMDAELKLAHLADRELLLEWDSPTAAFDEEKNVKKMARILEVPSLPNRYLSPDGRTLLFDTVWLFSSEVATRTVRQVRKFLQHLRGLDKQGQGSGVHVVSIGLLSISEAMSTETLREILVKEGCMVPIAILVLIWQVRSPRLACLAGLVMGVSVVVSVGSLFFLAMGVTLTATSPTIVVVVGLALSVDYSLFIFGRFREELQAGTSGERSVEIAVESSGSVILVSGVCLVGTCLASLLFPGESVWVIGVCGALAVFVIMVVNLTLTPCLMYMFLEFFKYGLTADTAYCGGVPTRGSRVWLMWGKCVTTGWRPVIVVAVLYGAMIPVILQLRRYEPTTAITHEIPRGSRLAQAYGMLLGMGSAGADAPIFLVQLPGDVRSDAAFDEGCERMRRLVHSTRGTAYELAPADFLGPFAVPGAMAAMIEQIPGNCPPLTCLRWQQSPPECPFLPSAEQMLRGGSLANIFLPGLDKAYQELWRRTVNSDNSSAITEVIPRIDAVGSVMRGFYGALRELDYDGMIGLNILMYELSQACQNRIPLMVLVTLAIVSLFIGASFGTVLAPIKLFMSVVVPLLFVYGVVVCVYIEGALTWTHFFGLRDHGVFFLLPTITLPVVIGLAVDYDVFLFSRIYELRQEGYDNRSAVVGAVAATGPSITSAGIIMALAFFGMMLSSMPINCEMGFCVFFAVLLDTFVIRGALVPCVLCVGDSWNYWPQKMPTPTLTLEDLEEHFGTAKAGGGLSSDGKRSA